MPSRLVRSCNAPAMSSACARLSRAHGPPISASGNLLPKRTLPTATTGLGFALIGILAADHDSRARRGQPQSLHGGECRRPQKRALDVCDDRAVPLAVIARLVPCRVGLECVPFLFTVGERVPNEHVMQVLAAVAHQHGPETGRLDAVLVPDFQSLLLEPLEQNRQPA